MSNYRIAVMEGDGIGPEITKETVKILQRAEQLIDGLSFDFVDLPVGLKALETEGATLPASTFEKLQQCDGGILGPLTTHLYEFDQENTVNPSGTLRKKLDLYANLRPAKNFDGVQTKFDNVDLLIVRENTEGMYPDRNLAKGSGEFMPDLNTVMSFRVVTRHASERLAKIGFELANQRKKSAALIHKKNILRQGCGMFVDSCLKVSANYSDVTVEDHHIDAFSMFMVQRPEEFDVITTTNMFGDILSDLAAGLVGGLGLAPGLNLGDRFMLAQAAHGSAPDIAGKNIANPVSEILSAKMMLEWLGIRNRDDKAGLAAELINQAVENALRKGSKTRDLGGSLNTDQFGNQVIFELEQIHLNSLSSSLPSERITKTF